MNHIINKLEEIKRSGNLRVLKDIDTILSSSNMINLASNDYLGLNDDIDLANEFWNKANNDHSRLSAVSSRLLTGNHNEYIAIESLLEKLYNKPALFFGSGYHANSGVIPALCDKNTLILADKLSHASMIDGIRLSEAKNIRFRHNDYDQLEKLIRHNHNQYSSIVIITESIFSMDGDEADLERLVKIKKSYDNVFLYVDEAHAVGVRGKKGLGCCEEKKLIADIDIILCTCGKALASTGAYIICNDYVKEYLINTCRTLIFTTALPAINIAWTRYIIENLSKFEDKRSSLYEISKLINDFLRSKNISLLGSSHIIPIVIGESEKAVMVAEKIQQEGFFVLPVRPPTVPKGTARLRISLSASHKKEDIIRLISILEKYV